MQQAGERAQKRNQRQVQQWRDVKGRRSTWWEKERDLNKHEGWSCITEPRRVGTDVVAGSDEAAHAAKFKTPECLSDQD